MQPKMNKALIRIINNEDDLHLDHISTKFIPRVGDCLRVKNPYPGFENKIMFCRVVYVCMIYDNTESPWDLVDVGVKRIHSDEMRGKK